MKIQLHIFLFTALFYWGLSVAEAQNIGINTTGATPNASALLDIDAAPGNSKGLLIPRLTTAQMNAISTPATGLIIYNIDCNTFNYYNGNTWIAIGNTGSVTAPGAITGNATPCQNATGVAYSITAVSGATGYNWTVPTGASVATGQGTISVTVNFATTDGNVCVTASNACGTSNASCTAITLQSAPAVPTATAASNIAQTSFDANWNASAGATTYYLDVATDAGFTSFVTGYNNLNVGNVTTYGVTGLTCATAYYYRVRAGNSCGISGNSNTISTTTTACCAIDFQDDFTVDQGWITTDATTMDVDIGAQNLKANYEGGSVNRCIVYDLGAGNVSNTTWLLRFEWTPGTETGADDEGFWGISSNDQAAGNATAQDFIGNCFLYQYSGAQDGLYESEADNTSLPPTSNGQINIVWAIGTTYYIELIRLSATSFKYSIYSDAGYFTLLGTQTTTIAATVTGLRYLKFVNYATAATIMNSRIDNIKFWNNRTTPCP